MKKFPAAPLSADSVRFARNHDTAGWKGEMGEEGRDGGSRGVLAGHHQYIYIHIYIHIPIHIHVHIHLHIHIHIHIYTFMHMYAHP